MEGVGEDVYSILWICGHSFLALDISVWRVLFYLMTLLDEILSSQSDDMMLKGDIIRVLTICMGALWIDELYPEVNVFRRALGDSPVSNREVDKALEDLVEAGFIDVSPRIKAGERAEGIKSKLVKLVNFHEIAGRVLRDERVSRYRALLRFR